MADGQQAAHHFIELLKFRFVFCCHNLLLRRAFRDRQRPPQFVGNMGGLRWSNFPNKGLIYGLLKE